MQLTRGKKVVVQVNDPGNQLSPPNGKHPKAAELSFHLVSAAANLHKLPISELRAGRRYFGLVVPNGQAHQLVVQSETFHLSDESGKDANTYIKGRSRCRPPRAGRMPNSRSTSDRG